MNTNQITLPQKTAVNSLAGDRHPGFVFMAHAAGVVAVANFSDPLYAHTKGRARFLPGLVIRFPDGIPRCIVS